MMRTGIFGGTFDPPHIGHLALATTALAQMKLDRIFWVLTPDPPHKRGNRISFAEYRKLMVNAVISSYPSFIFSDIEFKRKGPHYSVDTMRAFRLEYPGDTFYYLMGEDSLDRLPAWRAAAGFVDQCDGIIVMQRPGEEPDWKTLEAALPGLRQITHLLDAGEVAVSSSAIRQKVRNGQDWHADVLPEVAEIINANGLYRK